MDLQTSELAFFYNPSKEGKHEKVTFFSTEQSVSALLKKTCHLFAQTYTCFPWDSTLFRQKQKAKGREGLNMGTVLTIGLLLTILCGCWHWCWWGCCSRLSIGTLVIAVATLLVVGTLLMTSGGKSCNTLKSSLQKAASIKKKSNHFNWYELK